MLESINTYFTAYQKLVTQNPVLSGFAALYVTTVVTYLIRNIPTQIWNWIKTTFTTSVEMNNAGWSGNEFHYARFLNWFMLSPWSKWSRTLYTGRGEFDDDGTKTIVGPGRGNHFFFLNGRLFWFNKKNLESNGSNKQKEEITITTLGRSHQPLLKLIKLFEYKEDKNELPVYTWQDNYWCRMGTIQKNSLDTVFIPKEMKKLLLERHDRFVNDPQWFADKGIAYKITSLFFGEPGTGKTSLAKALASHYNRCVCILDLSRMSNQSLQNAMARLPRKSLLLIEDIDAASAAAKRRSVKKETPIPKKWNQANDTGDVALGNVDEPSTDLSSILGLTLAGLLNALDGIIPLHDVMVMLTTNHIEKLDPALIRDGRVDYKYEIGKMDNEEIHDFVRIMYPKTPVMNAFVFEPMVRASVQKAFRESPDSIQGFLKQIPYSIQNGVEPVLLGQD